MENNIEKNDFYVHFVTDKKYFIEETINISFRFKTKVEFNYFKFLSFIIKYFKVNFQMYCIVFETKIFRLDCII